MLYFIIVLLIIAIALLLKIALGTRASQDSRELREQLAFVRDQNSVQKELLEMLNQQNHQMHQTIDAKLAQTHQANQEQMGQTQRLIHNMSAQSLETITKVTAKLTQLDETKLVPKCGGWVQSASAWLSVGLEPGTQDIAVLRVCIGFTDWVSLLVCAASDSRPVG